MGDRVHGELGHQYRAAFIAFGRPLQRHSLGEGFICDQHTGSMGAYVVDDAFQALCIVDQFGDVRFLFVGSL